MRIPQIWPFRIQTGMLHLLMCLGSRLRKSRHKVLLTI
jgi:hypothetical protein